MLNVRDALRRSPGYSFESIARGLRGWIWPEPVSRDYAHLSFAKGGERARLDPARICLGCGRRRHRNLPGTAAAQPIICAAQAKSGNRIGQEAVAFRARIIAVVRGPTANGVAVSACVSRRFQLVFVGCAITSISNHPRVDSRQKSHMGEIDAPSFPTHAP